MQTRVGQSGKKINYLNIFMILSPRFTKTDSQAHEAVAICAQLDLALPRCRSRTAITELKRARTRG